MSSDPSKGVFNVNHSVPSRPVILDIMSSKYPEKLKDMSVRELPSVQVISVTVAGRV